MLLLRTYHGAPTIPRNTLFWKVWIILIFDILAHPQSCNPYIQTGFKICLYKSILFYKSNLECLPKSQCILLYIKFSSLFFILICDFLSLVSSVIPMHFASNWNGITWELTNMGVLVILLFVKLTWLDLNQMYTVARFQRIRYFCVHNWSFSIDFWSLADAFSTVYPTATTAVLSAKVTTVYSPSMGMSLVYSTYRTGPRTLPSGTPALIYLNPEYSFPCLARNILSVK